MITLGSNFKVKRVLGVSSLYIVRFLDYLESEELKGYRYSLMITDEQHIDAEQYGKLIALVATMKIVSKI